MVLSDGIQGPVRLEIVDRVLLGEREFLGDPGRRGPGSRAVFRFMV